METTPKEKFILSATIAEKEGRFQDMRDDMKNAVLTGEEMTANEHRMLDTVYKQLIESHQEALQFVDDMEKDDSNSIQVHNLATHYHKQVGFQMQAICLDILELVDVHLIPLAKTSETRILCCKLIGDYLQRLAEMNRSDGIPDFILENCEHAYRLAYEIAGKYLSPTHPLRLEVAFAYAIFTYAMLNDRQKARQLAIETYTQSFVADIRSGGTPANQEINDWLLYFITTYCGTDDKKE